MHDLLNQLHSHLSSNAVSLEEFPRQESIAIQKGWTSLFGRFELGTPHKHGSKAVDEWLSSAGEDLILLFLSSRITAFPISISSRPCSAFKFVGMPIDLSSFNELEFAVFPANLSWTLVHTHEDGAFGGPYFVRAEDIG